MLPRPQKPSLRDFRLMHARTRAHLCSDDEIFDPCVELKYLTWFEKATLTSWAADSNVDIRPQFVYIITLFIFNQ